MPEWIGKTVGKVRIEKLLAHGGMAEVYLGTHLTLERPVALKVLHGYIEDQPELRERFQREARVVAGLRHPNIVQVYDFDAIDGHPYIVMEYLKGPTLATYLRSLHDQKERLPLSEVARLLKGLAVALDYAHGLGVFHRDIKPGNIMLHGKNDIVPVHSPFTAGFDVVVTDFGLVRIAHSAHQTTAGTITGTPNYMSPEQASGNPTDHRTDIYSLGVVLYEMLAGRVPFEGDTTLTVIYRQINDPPPAIPGLSPTQQAVIDRALAKKPDDRYQSCINMAADFASTLASETVGRTVRTPVPAPAPSPAPAGPATVTTRPDAPRRFPWMLAASLGVAALAVLALGAFVVLPRIISPSNQPAVSTQAPAPTTASSSVPAGLADAEGMVKVAAGSYQLGMAPADEFHSASQSLDLREFWIDRYLVTNSQYQQYLQETGAPQPVVWPGDPKHPVRGVTWDQAEAYCERAYKRLPSEAEWEAAGRGAGENPQLYPWGTDPTAGGLALQMPDQDTYEVGSVSFNKSPLGVFDLVGDVWQWVGDAYGAIQPGFHVLRGGRFGLPQDLAYRLAVAPDDARYVKFAGFRCAASQVK